MQCYDVTHVLYWRILYTCENCEYVMNEHFEQDIGLLVRALQLECSEMCLSRRQYLPLLSF